MQVNDGGALNVTGADGHPAVFTSWSDDSIGGDTNSATAFSGLADLVAAASGIEAAAAPGDWAGIRVATGGTAALDQVAIRYASTALDVGSDADVVVRGSITDSTRGIRTDSWVDALYVNWGSDSGPGVGGNPPVEGPVTYAPWHGYDMGPERTPPVHPQQPQTSECKDVLVVGLRGSGELPQGPPPDYGFKAYDHDGFGSRAWDAYYGFQTELRKSHQDVTIREYGIRYKGLGVAHNPLTTDYLDSVYEGNSQLQDHLTREVQRCWNDREQIVLIGYSQGALAIHLALRELSDQGASWIVDRISTVILIADPAKVKDGNEHLFEAKNKTAGSGVKKADGIWQQLMKIPRPWKTGPIPASLTDRTVSICHDKDFVCAPYALTTGLPLVEGGRFSYGVNRHTHYSADELNWIGEQAAQYTANRLPTP